MGSLSSMWPKWFPQFCQTHVSLESSTLVSTTQQGQGQLLLCSWNKLSYHCCYIAYPLLTQFPLEIQNSSHNWAKGHSLYLNKSVESCVFTVPNEPWSQTSVQWELEPLPSPASKRHLLAELPPASVLVRNYCCLGMESATAETDITTSALVGLIAQFRTSVSLPLPLL